MVVYKIGDQDAWGNILKRQKWPVQLWETPNGNYLIYLWVTEWDTLHTYRKHRKDADALFDGVCDTLT